MIRIKTLFFIFFGFCFLLSKAQSNLDDFELDYARPLEYEIGGIVIEGTEYLDKNILLQASELIIGSEINIPGEKITKAINNLWELNLFSDVTVVATKIIGKKIFLKIKVEERPRLSKFAFAGVKKGDQDDIREKIKLIKGKIVTDNLLVNTKNRIEEFYIDKGYMDAEVSILQKPDTSQTNQVILFINVKKNKKVRIKNINFIGATQVKKSKLKRYLKETKEYKWWNIFKQSKYIEENLEKDKENLISKYNTKGFRDVRIIKDSVYKVAKGFINLDIYIDEGNKYYFGDINWIGNTKYSTQQLNGILGIKKGDVFNQSLLEQRLNMSQDGRDVSSLYMDDGYLFFQVNPAEISVENDTINLEMRVYEGKQARISRVTVSGNTKTNDRVIMREIRTRPGMLFSRSDIMRTQRELSQLRYFDEQKMGVNPKPNPADGTVDIEYTVEEKPSDQVELSAGWGNRALIGTLGLSFNNFSAKRIFKKDAWAPLPAGDGQALSIRAQSTGLAFQNYSFSFVEPWLGGKRPNSFSFTVYHTRQNPLQLRRDDERRQLLTVTGVSLGLGKRLKVPDDYFQLYQELSFQQYFLKQFRVGINFPVEDGTFLNFSYKLNLSRSSVDAPIYPKSGSTVSTTLQITPPYSLFRSENPEIPVSRYYSTVRTEPIFVEYYKWKVSTSFFTELAKNLVLNFRAGVGILGTYNQQLGYSPFERFWLGGSGLVGFALDGREVIALRGFDQAGHANEGENGAVAVCKYVLEMRYPISLNPSATIFGLAFLEAGNGWESTKRFNPFNVARCGGVGMRVFLPMFGLLGLDYGWAFDDPYGKRLGITRKNLNQGVFLFTIGANIGDL